MLGGSGVISWEIGIDMYTLICIRWITNENLLYKKINNIKFKNSKKKKKGSSWGFPGGAVVKNLPANAGDMGLGLGPGRSHKPQSN